MSDTRTVSWPTKDAMTLADYIKGHLESVKDEGSHIDAGGGFGARDIWVMVEGREFMVTVKECRPRTAKRRSEVHAGGVDGRHWRR